MRVSTFLLATAAVALAAPRAEAKFPDPVAMDGPVADVCASLTRSGGTCVRAAATKIGGVAIAVYVVTPPAASWWSYRVAVRRDDGWYLSHDELAIEMSWREHGPGHTLAPRRPHLVPLALDGGRPAIGVDIPITMTIDDCDDAARPAGVRCGRSRSRGAPAALLACGERADGGWACVPPATTHSPLDPPPRFLRDGSVRGDRGGFRGYDVVAHERIAF